MLGLRCLRLEQCTPSARTHTPYIGPAATIGSITPLPSQRYTTSPPCSRFCTTH